MYLIEKHNKFKLSKWSGFIGLYHVSIIIAKVNKMKRAEQVLWYWKKKIWNSESDRSKIIGSDLNFTKYVFLMSLNTNERTKTSRLKKKISHMHEPVHQSLTKTMENREKKGLNIEYNSYWRVIKGQEGGGTCCGKKERSKESRKHS